MYSIYDSCVQYVRLYISNYVWSCNRVCISTYTLIFVCIHQHVCKNTLICKSEIFSCWYIENNWILFAVLFVSNSFLISVEDTRMLWIWLLLDFRCLNSIFIYIRLCIYSFMHVYMSFKPQLHTLCFPTSYLWTWSNTNTFRTSSIQTSDR